MNGDFRVIGDPPDSGSWIEIDAACLEANIAAIREHIAPAEYCMVVKGNSYGHGYDPMIPLAEANGVRRFAVFSAREAAAFLRASDGQSRLMVMGHASHGNLPWLVENDLEPWLTDPHDWPALKKAAEHLDRPVRVHLEVETGMNRTGLSPKVAIEVAREIHKHPLGELEGLCTHLAGRESSENNDRTERQWEWFQEVEKTLRAEGIRPNVRHVSSSAASIMDPDFRLDMCRIGIASYGLWPGDEVMKTMQRVGSGLTLRNVLQWKSRVVATKDVADGQFVGYGRSFEAEGDTRIAVVGVGYSDGFARDLSNRGHVLIRGRRASIVGNVGMNMIQVNIRHIPDVEVGDEVVLIGRQGQREISVASFADFNSIVNYELMARLSRDVPRHVVYSEPAAPPLE